MPPSSPAFQITGPGGGSITVAADPSTPGTLFASSFESGLFKSADGGTSWNRFATNATNNLINATGIAIAQDGTLYVLCYCGANSSTVYQSTDHGNTFTDIGESFSNGVSSVTPDPLNSDVLYLTDLKGTIYRSEDSAKSWTTVALPQTPGCPAGGACSATVTPDVSTEGTLYYLSTGIGIYVSHDYGTTWTLINGTITGPFYLFAQSTSDPMRLYVDSNTCPNQTGSNCDQLFSSSDGGATWSSKSSNVEGESIAINPTNPDDIYVFANTYLDPSPFSWVFNVFLHSTDGGASWSIISGPTLYPAVDAAFGYSMEALLWPENSSYMIGIIAHHIWQIPPGGASWTQSDHGLTGNYGVQIAVDPNFPNTLFLAASNNDGISKSTDGGTTWKSTLNGSSQAVAVDPFNSMHVLAGVAAGEDPLTYSNALQVSSDGGNTWSNGPASIGLPFNPTEILFDPKNQGTIYLGAEEGGLSKSIDGGATWSAITSGMNPSSNPGILFFAIDPTNSQNIVAATATGIYKSINAGQSWIQVQSSQMNSVAWDPNHAGVVYAAGWTLLKSTDYGDSWSDITPALSGNPALNIVVDPNTADTLFVIASLDTVGWSPDAGQTWVWFQTVLPQTYLTVTGDFASIGGAISLPVMSTSNPGVLYIPSATSGIISLTVQQ